MKDRPRAALYARVSTKDKGQDSENQLAQLRQFCAANHWPIAAEFVDHVSGKRSDREQFQAMFASASRREFDYLVTWALDRLSREGVSRTFEHIKELCGFVGDVFPLAPFCAPCARSACGTSKTKQQ